MQRGVPDINGARRRAFHSGRLLSDDDGTESEAHAVHEPVKVVRRVHLGVGDHALFALACLTDKPWLRVLLADLV